MDRRDFLKGSLLATGSSFLPSGLTVASSGESAAERSSKDIRQLSQHFNEPGSYRSGGSYGTPDVGSAVFSRNLCQHEVALVEAKTDFEREVFGKCSPISSEGMRLHS